MAEKYAVALAKHLKAQGFSHCFYVAGGNIMHLLEAFSHELTCVPFVHEVATGIAAEYFTATAPRGERAMCLVTAGPGVTNVMTAVAGAFTESRELLVIAGQVKSSDLASNGLKQRGIQEIDGMSLMSPITKARVQLREPSPLSVVDEVISKGSEARPGPVYIEVCLNVQAAPYLECASDGGHSPHALARGGASVSQGEPSLIADTVSQVRRRLGTSERPVLLLGGGISREVANALRLRLKDFGVPIATTWNALDRIDYDDDLNFGRPDTWGMRWSNLLIQQADLVIAVGARLSLQQTGFNWRDFAPLADVVHVDADEAEVAKEHPRKWLAVKANPEAFLEALIESPNTQGWGAWRDFGQTVKSLLPLSEAANTCQDGFVNTYEFVGWLSQNTRAEDVIVPCSSGGAETVLMQAFRQKLGQIVINNGALASMGYGLAGAIGAALAWPERRVILTEGDGGFAQNLQELGTVQRANLNLKMIIWENNGYGSIRMTQKRYFAGHYVGCDTATGLGLPDWAAVVKAYGIPMIELVSLESPHAETLADFLAESGPGFVLVRVDPDQTYLPKIDSVIGEDGQMRSAPLHRMSPDLAPETWSVVAKYLGGMA